MKTDSIFYQIFLELPSIFFRLVGQPPNLANSYQFRSVEIKQTSFRLDGVLVPNNESATTPIHFGEVQMQKDDEFYWRFFAEIFLYLYQYKVEHWRAAVVFRRRSIEPTVTQPYQALLNSPQVTRIYLEDLGEDAYDDLGLGIVRLIVEAKRKTVERARELTAKARAEVADEATRETVLELLKTILLYKFKELEPQEVMQMLGLEEFKQSRLYKGMMEMAKEDAKQEVREESLVEGKLFTVPLLLEAGFSVEEIAQRLNLTVEQVQRAAQSQSN